MRKRAAADERLRNFLHADRGQEPGGAAFVLESVLERQAVDHGCRHPHVMGGRFLDHVRTARKLRPRRMFPPPTTIASWTLARRHAGGLPRDLADLVQAQASLAGPAEALARELEHHAAKNGLIGRWAGFHEALVLQEVAHEGRLAPLAEHEPGEPGNRDILARAGIHGHDHVADRLGIVLDKLLVEQDVSPNQALSLPSAIFSCIWTGFSLTCDM